MVGIEWVVDALGCRPDALRDTRRLQGLCEEILHDLELRALGAPRWHQFPGEGGITGLYLLSESHLACHTYPEHGVATFNLYSCRERPEWPWRERMERALEAGRVTVRRLERALPGDGP
jgi:S-adenosylmethionine decarboxylase